MSILDECTHVFAEPGAHFFIDVINPITDKSWINGEDLDAIKERYPAAEIVLFDDWTKARAAEQDAPVTWEEATEENFNDMLNVLPPIAWDYKGFLVGEPVDHHAGSGRPRYQAFIRRGGKHYSSDRAMTVAEFKEYRQTI